MNSIIDAVTIGLWNKFSDTFIGHDITRQKVRDTVEASLKKVPDAPLWHQSGVAPTGEAFVQLLLGDQIIGQLDMAQARDHARMVLESAESAEQDAFLMDFARNVVGVDAERAGQLLVAFRNYRQEKTGKSQGPRSKKDWVMPPANKMPEYGDFWKKQ